MRLPPPSAGAPASAVTMGVAASMGIGLVSARMPSVETQAQVLKPVYLPVTGQQQLPLPVRMSGQSRIPC